MHRCGKLRQVCRSADLVNFCSVKKQGQIKYADNPVLVYEGDEFQHGMRDNVPS